MVKDCRKNSKSEDVIGYMIYFTFKLFLPLCFLKGFDPSRPRDSMLCSKCGGRKKTVKIEQASCDAK